MNLSRAERGKRRIGRTATCAALLMLLAASGYTGADAGIRTESVCVPIVFETADEDVLMHVDLNEEKDYTMEQREEALRMLEEVIANPASSQETIQKALEEKTRMAANMETEAKIEEALARMGMGDIKAVCGTQALTLIASQRLPDEKSCVQIVDVSCGISGISPERIKIILAKNE